MLLKWITAHDGSYHDCDNDFKVYHTYNISEVPGTPRSAWRLVVRTNIEPGLIGSFSTKEDAMKAADLIAVLRVIYNTRLTGDVMGHLAGSIEDEGGT
jgi:hypothetical protein